ncbi:MAG TPA: hypothetical protein VKD91_06515 [Pyrinomonadaceae bacterium]|nr:hypothetical protein [Pyrinomonadaceae bacterium]
MIKTAQFMDGNYRELFQSSPKIRFAFPQGVALGWNSQTPSALCHS